MLSTVIKKNSYQDSINLMLLTNAINALPGVTKSQIMMGTDANKDIFRGAGLLTDEAAAASPSDMVIVVDSESKETVDEVLAETERFLSDLSVKKDASQLAEVESWDDALEALPDANLALFSTPGEYTAPEIEHALDLGLNVFSFTDNISLDEFVRLGHAEMAKPDSEYIAFIEPGNVVTRRTGLPAQASTNWAHSPRACRRCRPTTSCAPTAAASPWSTSAWARPTPKPSPTTSPCCARTPG